MTRRQISHHKQQQRRQRIIFFGGVGIIAAIILVILGGWIATDYIPLHRTVIEVNDTKINAGEFVGYLEITALNQKIQKQQNPSMTEKPLEQLASEAAAQMPKDELTRQAAEVLGVTVSDDEAKEVLKNNMLPVNNGSIAYIRSFLLRNKLQTDYFGAEVPKSDKQVWSNLMLLESDVRAAEIRGRLELGENFTALAPEFAQNYYSKNINDGDFGWHPSEVLRDQIGSDIPLDFAFNAEAGALSQPLYDAEMYKQLGYWLIRVNEKVSENQTNADALYLSSAPLAQEVKLRLENGEDLAAIADSLTQYSVSKEKHGQLGVVDKASMPDVFSSYAFSDNAVLGRWSEPIPDTTLWTQGGYWLVKVVDKADDRALSDEDRSYLIGKRFDAWYADLDATAAGAVKTDALTPEVTQWAVDRANRFLENY
jgi:parvulin-like peptidyl-prolyl isomerase